MMVLNLLCSRLMEKENEHLLQVFFDKNKKRKKVEEEKEEEEAEFLIFSILVGFLHRDGLVGQHARDSLLLCMSLSEQHESVGRHIARNTNFCPVSEIKHF